MNAHLRVAALVLVLASACATTPGPTPDAEEESIRRLLRITGASNLGEKMGEQLLGGLRNSLPGVPQEFWDEISAEFSSDELTNRIVPIYARHYTQQEIQGLIDFYSTPLGKALIAKMPAVTQESVSAGQEWGRSGAG